MSRTSRHTAFSQWLACLGSLLLPLTGAVDFALNQQHPNGKPLVSSSFGVPGNNATFDYIVVGGGTAGLAMSTRLSQAGLSVAVIEAGGFYETDNSNLSVVPAYATFFTGSDPTNFQPLVDWALPLLRGSANRSIHYARGKVLGGSSARNYYLYQRATVDSLQKWADDVEDQSYTWDNLLPYYKKAVHFTPPNETRSNVNSSNPYDAAAFEPDGGPVQVSFSNSVDPLGTWFHRAFPEVGMPQLPGFSSGYLIGSGYALQTIDPVTAYRSSSEASYLQTALNNHSAPIVYKNTLAAKILFNGTTATGVSALTQGTYGTPSVNFTLTARKEVILSAGAFQSPQLLMVSGIGNCTELAAFNISCKMNLPGVGKNMWDHPVFGTIHAVNVNTASAGVNNATLANELIQTYLESASGPDSIFGPDYYGFEKLPEPYRSKLSNETLAQLATFPPDWPEIEWLPNGAYNGYEHNKQTADPKDGKNYGTLLVALVSPLSRGTVTLNSPDMWHLPNVDPAWYTAQADKEMVLQAFKRARAIWQVLADLGVADPVEALPGPVVQTDEQIMQYIGEAMITGTMAHALSCLCLRLGYLRYVLSVYHASGTNKMGCKNDTMAVVDSNAFVFGTKNLRILKDTTPAFTARPGFEFNRTGHGEHLTSYGIPGQQAEVVHSEEMDDVEMGDDKGHIGAEGDVGASDDDESDGDDSDSDEDWKEEDGSDEDGSEEDESDEDGNDEDENDEGGSDSSSSKKGNDNPRQGDAANGDQRFQIQSSGRVATITGTTTAENQPGQLANRTLHPALVDPSQRAQSRAYAVLRLSEVTNPPDLDARETLIRSIHRNGNRAMNAALDLFVHCAHGQNIHVDREHIRNVMVSVNEGQQLGLGMELMVRYGAPGQDINGERDIGQLERRDVVWVEAHELDEE
ncbi:hypothetical protein B0A55_03965 [Friedmanniomyces simplex]|uniref:Glucose-methanol-choline oxidoreductase N-terminal domain-containing protein n=1 Tax=Friedmanniomyces simplex TaxID=329884 RepID=A0A4U0XVS6_9PEZI|nr:hypothetical protein B0A55_03965 [Friedmanniomyces simplex]